MMISGRWRLEAYQDVAVKELERIAEEAREKFSLLSVDIVHRIGRLKVGDNILIIVVGAGHRKEAYEGSRFIIEAIKAGVPVWKKELRKDGGRWVRGRASPWIPWVTRENSYLPLFYETGKWQIHHRWRFPPGM